jgi:hypothetical protein
MKPARWPRLKKWFKRLAFALIAFVTLVALGLAIEGYRAKRAWDACQNELAAMGESLNWQAHVAAPVPDDQNLLATPLLAACFGFDASTESPRQQAERTDACAELHRLSDWTHRLSGPGSWRQGTVVPLADWQATLRSTHGAGAKPLSAAMRADLAESFGGAPEDYESTADPTSESAWEAFRNRPPASPIDDLRFLLGMHQAELDEIRLAARRPFAQLPLDPAVFSETFMARLSALKPLARLFAISSWTELTAGNPEAAVTDIETMLSLSDAPVSQPLLISALVQIALVESAISPIWAGLVERRWDDAQLARLEARLDQVNLVADMRRCLRGERVFALTLLSAAQTRTGQDSNVLGDDMMPIYRALRWWPRAFLYRNQSISPAPTRRFSSIHSTQPGPVFGFACRSRTRRPKLVTRPSAPTMFSSPCCYQRSKQRRKRPPPVRSRSRSLVSPASLNAIASPPGFTPKPWRISRHGSWTGYRPTQSMAVRCSIGGTIPIDLRSIRWDRTRRMMAA